MEGLSWVRSSVEWVKMEVGGKGSGKKEKKKKKKALTIWFGIIQIL
jgi:hypothetical protein